MTASLVGFAVVGLAVTERVCPYALRSGNESRPGLQHYFPRRPQIAEKCVVGTT